LTLGAARMNALPYPGTCRKTFEQRIMHPRCDVAAQHLTTQYRGDVNEYFSFYFGALIIR
jgi:hypothetical protein